MSTIAKARMLLQTIKNMAMFLTDDEISDIGKVLQRAILRMSKEQSWFANLITLRNKFKEVQMSKYKANQKVRVKKGLIPLRVYSGEVFQEGMTTLCGSIVTIESEKSYGAYWLKEDSSVWTDEMLEDL